MRVFCYNRTTLAVNRKMMVTKERQTYCCHHTLLRRVQALPNIYIFLFFFFSMSQMSFTTLRSLSCLNWRIDGIWEFGILYWWRSEFFF